MTDSKRALITGITGQDGSYLAENLLGKGYTVYGIIRRASTFNTGRIDHIFQDPHEKGIRLILRYGDLTDAESIATIIQEVQPDEVYHLASQSHVRVSFDIPVYTAAATGQGTLHILEAVRKYSPRSKFYQASSSEMFGKVRQTPQTENTPFYPRSPYGCAKVFAYWITVNYRESFGLFACNGILFNHESPRRGATFVTRKITRAAAAVSHGSKDVLYIGNLEARRDWGYAPEYVEAMWRILQQEQPDDYVIATGETHSVRELVEAAFSEIGVTISWQGSGRDEKGYDSQTGDLRVAIDPIYYRPAEVDLLTGNSAKAEKALGWKPVVRFRELVKLMVQADIAALKEGTHYKFR
jgi:GDPmannose 4,6-dehydratase